MRGSFADYEKEQLMKQIVFTLQRTKIIEDCNAVLQKATRKPIRFAWYVHVVPMWIFSGITMMSMGYDVHETMNPLWILPIAAVFYMTFLFTFNRLVLVIKQVKYEKELREMPKQRQKAREELNKYSEIPKDYWKYHYMLLMKSYLDNKRADTMKECLNLLEDDIRNLNLQAKLNELEQHIRIDHTHSHHVIYDSRDRVATGYYEETTFIEETTYVDDELVEDTVYEVDSDSDDWDVED